MSQGLMCCGLAHMRLPCACSGGRDPPAPRASQAEAVALQTLPDSVPNPTRLRISPSMAHIRYSALPGLTSASSQQSGSHELEVTPVEAAGGHPLQVRGCAHTTLQKRFVSVSKSSPRVRISHNCESHRWEALVGPPGLHEGHELYTVQHIEPPPSLLQGGCSTQVSVLLAGGN